ncbi:hypothetical protein C8J57DRAFT_1335811 [Mycena rebaudengoi]|nr:hypothetical protein C8J57DRAFT_1335811 [Mycena rebaudengoi]
MQSQNVPQAPDVEGHASRPVLFEGATDFAVEGGQFVQGTLHNYFAAPPAASTLQPAVVMNAAASVPFRTASVVSTESEIYTSRLLRRGRGYPLYDPNPQDALPDVYRRRGVSIGDVGRVTPEGIFDFFFNIYLKADDPINANRVPEDFIPLAPYSPIDTVVQPFDPGNYVCSSCVRELPGLSTHFPGGDFMFRCRGPAGAILTLPHGAQFKKLQNVEALRRHAAEHAESWYKYINGATGRGRELTNGSLYLITGSEITESWGIISYQDIGAEEEFQLSFSPTVGANAGHQYRWQRGNPACRKQADNDGLTKRTTFLHGFTISLAHSIWGRLFGNVEIRQLGESHPSKPNSEFVPYGSEQSWLSRFFGFFSGSVGEKPNEPNDNIVTISDFPPTAKLFHPSQLLNDYLLHQAPQATVALTHDDDWHAILTDDGKSEVRSSLARPISDMLIVMEEHGAVFFQPKPYSTSPTNLLGDGSGPHNDAETLHDSDSSDDGSKTRAYGNPQPSHVSIMPPQFDFQALKAFANVAVAKLNSSKKTTDNAQLKFLYSELSLALNASSSRIDQHTKIDSDSARIVKLVHDMAVLFMGVDRKASISSFLGVHLQDLERVLADVHKNTEPSGADEEQYRIGLERELKVLVQELVIEGVSKKPSQVPGYTKVLGNYQHTVVIGNQMNNIWGTPEPSLFHSLMGFQNRNPAISPPADFKPKQGQVEDEK